MLRRAIAVGMMIAIAILLLPCGAPAQSQNLSHECCAPTASGAGADCCNTATPKPATTISTDRVLEGTIETAVYLPHPYALPAIPIGIALQCQPSLRLPATILRT